MVLVLRRVEHRKCEGPGEGDDDADDDTECDRKAFDEHGPTIGKRRLELDDYGQRWTTCQERPRGERAAARRPRLQLNREFVKAR
jgi:hypothetical protein